MYYICTLIIIKIMSKQKDKTGYTRRLLDIPHEAIVAYTIEAAKKRTSAKKLMEQAIISLKPLL